MKDGSQFQSDLGCDPLSEIGNVYRSLLLIDGFVGKVLDQFFNDRTPNGRVNHIHGRTSRGAHLSVMSINLVRDSPSPPYGYDSGSEPERIKLQERHPLVSEFFRVPLRTATFPLTRKVNPSGLVMQIHSSASSVALS